MMADSGDAGTTRKVVAGLMKILASFNTFVNWTVEFSAAASILMLRFTVGRGGGLAVGHLADGLGIDF